mgnify:FL=1
MHHKLKTDSDPFYAVLLGEKTHEIRFNDKDYQVGDTLSLQLTEYTGEEMRNGKPLEYVFCENISLKVTHVLKGYGLKDGWVILSVKKIDLD